MENKEINVLQITSVVLMFLLYAAILANPLIFLSKAYGQMYAAFRKKGPAAEVEENKSSKGNKKITDDFKNLLNHKHVIKAVKINSS